MMKSAACIRSSLNPCRATKLSACLKWISAPQTSSSPPWNSEASSPNQWEKLEKRCSDTMPFMVNEAATQRAERTSVSPEKIESIRQVFQNIEAKHTVLVAELRKAETA